MPYDSVGGLWHASTPELAWTSLLSLRHRACDPSTRSKAKLLNPCYETGRMSYPHQCELGGRPYAYVHRFHVFSAVLLDLLFNFHSRYSSSIGLRAIFNLGRNVPPDSRDTLKPRYCFILRTPATGVSPSMLARSGAVCQSTMNAHNSFRIQARLLCLRSPLLAQSHFDVYSWFD